MTLLAAILPGFRDIRSQFLVGAMWSAAIVLFAIRIGDQLHGLLIYDDILRIWDRLPNSIHIGVLATSVYLFGMILPPWTAALITKLRHIAVKRLFGSSKVYYPRPGQPGIILRLHVIRQWLFPPAGGSDGLISSAIRNSLPEETSDLAESLVGARIAEAELELAALRLSKDSPEQYQQYDRIKSEGEFRTSISPAIVAIALAFSQYATSIVSVAAILIFGVGSAVTIARQGHLLRSEAESLIATAMYLRWTGTPTIDAISIDLQKIHAGHSASLAAEIDCILSHVVAMRNPVVNQWLTSIMRHPSRLQIFATPGLKPIFEKYDIQGIRVLELYMAHDAERAESDEPYESA